MPNEEKTNTDHPAQSTSGKGGGKGAHSRDISTTRGDKIWHRGEGKSVEFGGVKYFSYNQAPVRQDRLQALTEAKVLCLTGFIDTSRGVDLTAPDAVTSRIPAIRQTNLIWTQAYELLRELAQDRDKYRHLPGALNDDESVFWYVHTYLYARMLLNELTAWQWLTQGDHAHIQSGIAARKVSRGRVNGLWEDLSAINMFPGFVTLADALTKPITGYPEEVVYHPTFPIPHGLAEKLWGSGARAPYSTPTRAGTPSPTSDDKYANMARTIELLIGALRRVNSAGFNLLPGIKEDFRNIASILAMMSVPANIMSWSSFGPGIVTDHDALDSLLRRGMWVGVDEVTGNDKWLIYPYFNQQSSMIEMRGAGQNPQDQMFTGLSQPLMALGDSGDHPSSDQLYLLGSVGYGCSDNDSSPNSTISKHRHILGFTQEDGWTAQATSFQGTAITQSSPLRQHQYSVRGQVSPGDALDVRVNDPVEHSAFVPAEDIGYHFLGWLSQVLKLPFMAG